MLDPCPRLRNPVVTPLLCLGQRLVPMAFALNPVPVAVGLQPGLPILGRIAPVGIDIPAGVGRVDHRNEIPAVVRAGRIGNDLTDELVRLVGVHRELVAMMALAVLLGPDRIQILLAPLGRFPVGRHGILVEFRFVVLAEVLPGRRYQDGINDLATARNQALLEQLRGDAIEDGPGACFADSVLKRPHSGPVRNVCGLGQPTEALVAHPVHQLVFHLFVRQVVQALEHQNAHHGLGGKRRPPTLKTGRTRGNAIGFFRQGGKVDAGLDLDERVAQLIEGLLMMLVGKQIGLDGAALLHDGQVNFNSGAAILTGPARVRFFEAPFYPLARLDGVFQRPVK